ncbi:MAG: VCBS repeat-containing protein [Planctomycetota bacterium]
MHALSLLLALGGGPQEAGATFAPPIRLEAGGAPLAVEHPGYAAPTWHDIDGDGLPDLVVGQFAGGRVRVHRQLEAGRFAEGTWLMAGGKVAEVPGVW